MDPIELICKTVIEILKNFTTTKRPLTPTNLQEAISRKEEILSLFYPIAEVSISGGGSDPSMAGRGLSRVSLSRSQSPKGVPAESISKLQEALIAILNNLGPIIKNNFFEQFDKLQKEISACDSISSLGVVGEQVGALVAELIDNATRRANFSSDFLVELGKDLHKMEEQLTSYRSYSTEYTKINSKFHDYLLNNTNDIYNTVDSNQLSQDLPSMITSKLNTILKAIDVKRKSDEVRLKKADSQIAELQNNLMTYKSEILQVKERSESLEKEVLLDGLTCVNNRRAYDLQIKESLRRYHRVWERLSLILIDVDHFKRVNDDYGHQAGDKVLTEVAKIIKSCLRQSDFLARYGGEELVAILNGVNAASALNVAEKIRHSIERTRFHCSDKVLHVTVSIGVTEIVPSDTEPETLFARVDKAMYQAKNEGRNRVCASGD